jgi:hypothetical protein
MGMGIHKARHKELAGGGKGLRSLPGGRAGGASQGGDLVPPEGNRAIFPEIKIGVKNSAILDY